MKESQVSITGLNGPKKPVIISASGYGSKIKGNLLFWFYKFTEDKGVIMPQVWFEFEFEDGRLVSIWKDSCYFFKFIKEE